MFSVQQTENRHGQSRSRTGSETTDPLNPVPIPAGADPFTPDARNPANTSDPRVVNRVETRSGGSSVLIAAIVLVLAVIAYFVFAPGSDNAPVDLQRATTNATPSRCNRPQPRRRTHCACGAG